MNTLINDSIENEKIKVEEDIILNKTSKFAKKIVDLISKYQSGDMEKREAFFFCDNLVNIIEEINRVWPVCANRISIQESPELYKEWMEAYEEWSSKNRDYSDDGPINSVDEYMESKWITLSESAGGATLPIRKRQNINNK